MFEDVTDPDRDSTWKRWIPPVDADEASRSVRWTCAVLVLLIAAHLWVMWGKLPAVQVGLEILALPLLAIVWLTRSRITAALLTAETIFVAVWAMLSPVASPSFEDRRTILAAILLPLVCGIVIFGGCVNHHRFRAEEQASTSPGEEVETKPG